MHLDDLDLLVAVRDHGSFTAAAHHHGTTQSRVSRAIARLEERLGLVLVRRSPRQVALTRAGQRLAEHAEQMLRDLAAVETELRGEDTMTGPLSLSTPPALGRRLLAAPLARFCAAHEGLQLDWCLGARRVDLIAEDIDVAVRFAPLAPTWERARCLLRGHYHLYAAPGLGRDGRALDLPSHPPLDDDRLAETLGTLPLIGLHATRLRDRWPLRLGGEVHWLPVAPRHWSDDVDALIALAVAGAGVTMLPDLLVQQEVATGRLVRLTAPEQALPAEVWANLGAQRPTARARALVQFLAEALAARPVPEGDPSADL